jgi:hypothetical protein
MAKSKEPIEEIMVDGMLRPMTSEEQKEYKNLIKEMKLQNDSKLQKEREKEIAISKLVSLGLTEQDIRAMGI